MKRELHCLHRHKKIIQDVVAQSDIELFAFGSRVKGTQREASDLDLGYYGPISLLALDKLDEAFRQSDLPFYVDVIDLKRCDSSFLRRIKKDLVPLQSLLTPKKH